ncbi:hypothetical protein EMPS_03692 [Entomortierella parvispora]|uniref:Uncharacterized protein n=1 Tax=Entomortierella parvispora TaxID=205924 RepID=A0A9P3H7V2_9FUNG|nr:hypothetical protein EMPS_03692 [Entomortierella parvispora]
MCLAIELVAYDGLMVIGLILLIVWILAMTDVIYIRTYGLEHIFVALAAVFIIAWIFTRCCCNRRRGVPVIV